MEQGKWDGVFYQIVNTEGGYEQLFNEVFGWLRRKTDFFSDQKKAEECIKQAGERNIKQFLEDQEGKEKSEKDRKRREEERKLEVQRMEAIKAEKAKIEKEAALTKAKEQPKDSEEDKEPKAEENAENKGEKKDDDDNEKPPKGNGGTTDKYVWTQTLEEVTINILMPNSNIRGKDLNVTLGLNKCLVQIKGETAIIDGNWPEQINTEDSLWTLEPTPEGKVLKLAIAKWSSKMGWWDCVVKGDPKINTQKIQPETSKISDIQDGEMKGQVEKMMFDMKQKQQGLPSSDDMAKQDKIKDFMKAHPEMDFSKAKIC